MTMKSPAVVGHVGFGGGAMGAPHALAALAALGQPTRLSIFRLLVRASLTASQPALAVAVGCPHNTLSTTLPSLSAPASFAAYARAAPSPTARIPRARVR